MENEKIEQSEELDTVSGPDVFTEVDPFHALSHHGYGISHLKIMPLINLHCKKQIYIAYNKYGPSEYCFYEPGQNYHAYDMHQIVDYTGFRSIAQSKVQVRCFFRPNITSMWLSLPEIYKFHLYSLLYTPRRLFSTLVYNIAKDKWAHIDSVDKDDVAPTSEFTRLISYGARCKEDVLTTLAGGKSAKYISSQIMPIGHCLDECLEKAFMSGLMHERAMMAIERLLDNILCIVRGLGQQDECIKHTVVSIVNIPSPKPDGAFDISSSTSHSSDKSPLYKARAVDKRCPTPDSAMSSPSPPRKKKKGCDRDMVKARDHIQRKVDDDDDNRILHSKRHSFDLCVACLTRSPNEDGDERAKYLLLVDIHSNGKSFEEATKKFKEEMLLVLQSQTHVFGLFIGTRTVHLYKYERDVRRNIVINVKIFDLVRPSMTWSRFSVADLQELIMDIMSAIIEGIKFIQL